MGASQGGLTKKTLTLPVVLLPDAAAELKDALARYESSLRQCEAIQYIARRDGDELLAIHRITHRRCADPSACLKVPLKRTGLRVESDHISVTRGREDKAS